MQSNTDHNVFKNSVLSLAVLQVAKYVFPLLTLPYLTRTLGQDAYSVRAYTLSFMAFIQVIIDFGFAQYGTRAVAERCNDSSEISFIHSSILLAKTMLMALSFLIVLACMFFIPLLGTHPLFVIGSFLAIYAKALLPDCVLQGLEDMRPITVRYVISQGLALPFIIVFVKNAGDLNLIPIIEGCASVFALLWMLSYLKRKHSIVMVKCSIKRVKEVLGGSFPFFFAAAASSFMAGSATLLMGVFPTSALTISCWSITTTVLSGMEALWQPVSRALFPHIVKRRDYALVRKLLVLGVLVVLATMFASMILSDFIVLILGGEEYLDGSYILRYTLLALPFSYVVSIIGYPVLGAAGLESKLSLAIGVAGAFQMISLVICGVVGSFNASTVVAVRVGSEALLCLIDFHYARKVLKTWRL